MRSSVVESNPSRSRKTRDFDYTSRPESHIPRSQHQNPKTPLPYSKYHLALTPAEGWLALLLLAVASYSVVFAIISVGWVSHTFILYWSTSAGLLVGLLIAKIHSLTQTILHVGACLVGHWLSIALTSMVAFHISPLLLLAALRSVLTGGFDGALTPNSEMLFLFYLSFLSFFLGYFGAWLTYRAHLPLLVGLVYCSVLFVNLNYAKQDLSLVVIILLAALILLIARMQLASQLSQWISEGLHTNRAWLRGITWRCMQVSCIFALLALLMSWMLPILGEPAAGETFWDRLDNVWSNITHGQIDFQNPGSFFSAYSAPANFFGDSLTITGDVFLPSGEVLYYTTSAGTSPSYLEGFTYDKFDGHTWTSSFSVPTTYPANAQLPLDPIGNYTSVTTSVTMEQPQQGSRNYIFGPALPASFSVPTALFRNASASSWMQANPMTADEHYSVISHVSTESKQNLSLIPLPQDGQTEPSWGNDGNIPILEEYYLQKPNNLPAKVLQTAQQWTRGATNAYDAMKMLESRLSNSSLFTYSLHNPPVPANVDVVSWLLQTRQGYCTYYATAMTIMARLLGMPARIVNGFTQGDFDLKRKVWAVNGSDAHSWVQVYFPNYGWINFDPTPGYSLARNTPLPTASPAPTKAPVSPTPTTSTKKPASAHSTPTTSFGSVSRNPLPGIMAHRKLLLALTAATLLLSLCILFIALCTYWWRNLYAGSSFVSGLFWRTCQLASWAGLPPRGWQTPYEYSSMLARYFPQTRGSLRRLTDLFVRERWAAPHETPHMAEEDDLARAWPHLRGALVRSLLKKTIIRRK